MDNEFHSGGGKGELEPDEDVCVGMLFDSPVCQSGRSGSNEQNGHGVRQLAVKLASQSGRVLHQER